MTPSHLKSFVVVDKDENCETSFATIFEARQKLVALVTQGCEAFIYINKNYLTQ